MLATAARFRSSWSTPTLTRRSQVSRGDRIAELVVQQVATADLIEVATLPGSERGGGGFGSSGGFGAIEEGVPA